MMNIDKALILSLLAAYTAKVGILGAAPSDAAIVLVLAAAQFLYNSQIQNKQITELNQKLNELTVAQTEQAKVLEDTRSAMSSIKLSQGLRPAK